ncbi:MAG: FAD-dependent oxidoreductase [Syntrophales bacterium]
MTFDRLFSPFTVAGMALRNRVVMLPMSTGFIEPDETAGERFIRFYEARAEGGAGLILIPFTPMRDGGHVEPGLYDDRFIPSLRPLTDRLHAAGAVAAAQLILSYFVILKGDTPELVGPSPVVNRLLRAAPRELTTGEIQLIVGEFGRAARRARDGGFDAVEVLVAAGYILNRFLSPISNTRTDAYGGSLENRMRIILEAIDAIRAEAGRDFPVICRLNVEEQMPGGHTIADMKPVLAALERHGVALINTYTGWHESPVPTVAPSLPKGAFAHLSERIKASCNLPVIASNRINDPATAEAILAGGQADLIGMGRALIADPALPNKAREGREAEITPCLACSQCLAQIMSALYQTRPGAGSIRSLCSVNPLAGREWEPPPAAPARKRRVFVVGAGPGGMTAAATAAARGHDVTVFDAAGAPGGRLVAAALPPFKEEIRTLIESQHVRARQAGVRFRFDHPVDPAFVEREKPDALVLATGADPLRLPVPGIDGPNVIPAEDVLTGRRAVRGRTVVIGGGSVGCETAEFLLERGVKDVTILEMLGRMADNVVPTYRPFFLGRLKAGEVKFSTRTTVTGITGGGVNVEREGVAEVVPADTVILAAGYRADPRKIEAFRRAAPEVHAVGDCVRARGIQEAVEEGFAVGAAL